MYPPFVNTCMAVSSSSIKICWKKPTALKLWGFMRCGLERGKILASLDRFAKYVMPRVKSKT